MTNALYYGDNLDVLRKYFPEGGIDLVYLDPPFNSNRDYNILFKERSGEPAQAQMKAFTDTWQWSERAYDAFCQTCPRPPLVELLQGFVRTLGRNDLTAYLVMMAPRLVELHRVLKDTGSLYLHCDPSASHYLKLILDIIFGPRQFHNELIWKRTSAHNSAKRYGPVHDVILFYTKSKAFTWNPHYTPYDPAYVQTFYRQQDGQGRFTLGDLTGAGVRHGETGQAWRGIDVTAKGRHWMCAPADLDALDAQGRIYWPEKGGMPRLKRYLDESMGVPMQDLILDIEPLGAHATERLGYPTQKPSALLERFLHASSNEGDLILDPFCGCGTAVTAAHKLGRRWAGIDITCLAIALIKYRLEDAFSLEARLDYQVIGEPVTASEAATLAAERPYEFQKWAISLIPRAYPYQDKKGADHGVDGVLFFQDDGKDPKKALIQVKGGHLGVSQVRDFAHVVQRDKATLGLFLSLEAPTRPMIQEAEAFGFYTTPLGNRRLPRLQLYTVGELLEGQPLRIPMGGHFYGVPQGEKVRTDGGQRALEW